jgi:hypothetical protein
MNLYEEIYNNFFIEKDLIPKGNFVEVKYEDFIINPLDEFKNIYDNLDIEGFKDWERSFYTYILS